MTGCDEDLMRRLPLPLARLYRQAANATVPLNRHQAAYFLWEASLKLLASTAVAAYAELGEPDSNISERLKTLARPALGDWWSFVRLLVPLLAKRGDAGFQQCEALLLGKKRQELRRAAMLDNVLRETLGQPAASGDSLRLQDLFDRLVRYRNRELGHGATGQRLADFYQRHADALLAGIPDILCQLDVLAGRRLVYVAEVKRKPSGAWFAECEELAGEMPRRIDTLEFPADRPDRIPDTQQVYLSRSSAEGSGPLARLHPLCFYDAETAEFFFLNSHRDAQRVEYLCYHSGKVDERPDLSTARTELLARLFGAPVQQKQVDGWAGEATVEEPAWESGDDGARSIGGFPLISKLGQGGMAVVYRAWQPSLGRQVALKCLLNRGDKKSEDRFAREVRALGRVNHPNLVKVYTSGVHDEQYFYAMELLEGATLGSIGRKLARSSSSAAEIDLRTWRDAVSTVCEEARKDEKLIGKGDDEPPWPAAPQEQPAAPLLSGDNYVRRVVELLRQTAEAAQALHEVKAVHRDIKPDNIMVSPDGTRAVLMDLGLAQMADEADGKLTRTRQFVGTLRYASPEQIMAIGQLDCRSDVYSLGATLWELLTLRPMFDATDETPTPQLMQRIPLEEPRAIRAICPQVSPDLEAIVMKCLEKDPHKRYASAQLLANDLGHWLHGEPVTARRRTLAYRLVRKVRRHRGRAAAIVAMLALQACLVAAIYHWGIPHENASTSQPTTAVEAQATAPPAVVADASAKWRTPNEMARAELPTRGGTVAAAAVRPIYALLVGCTQYDNFPTSEGPGNDVILLQRVLTDRFAVPPENVTVLSERSGSKRPTQENIDREIARLAAFSAAGDQVLILLDGLGSPFGFLPADAGPAPQFEKAYSPQKLNETIERMVRGGASVCLLVDGMNGESTSSRTISNEPMPKKSVVIQAGQPGEISLELPLPRGDSGALHGIFTYTVSRILESTPRPLTYNELASQVHDQYIAWGYTACTPRVAGPDADQLVLGGVWAEERPKIRVVHGADGMWKINAGAAQDLTTGSILAVYLKNSSGTDGKPLGYIKIETSGLEATMATVAPCEFAGLRKLKELAGGEVCSLVFSDFGYYTPELYLGPSDTPTLREACRSLTDMVKITTDKSLADWMVADESGRFVVRPAMGNPTAPPIAGPVDSAALTEWLNHKFPAVLRGQSLLSMAQKSMQERARVAGGSAPRLEVGIRKFAGADDAQGSALTWGPEGVIVQPGNRLAITIKNTGDAAADVTVLFVDSNFKIGVFYPSQIQDNRLEARGSIQLGGTVNADTVGWEHLVVIAAPASGQPVDFSFIAKPTVEAARASGGTRGLDGVQTIDSPLGKVLQKSLFASGDSRGLDPSQLVDYFFSVKHWQVVKIPLPPGEVR